MNNKIWIEKYRPSKLKNIRQNIDDNDLYNFLQNVILTKNLPHLLLYGTSGSGKTTTALMIAKELFSPNKNNYTTNSNYILAYKKILSERILELNASDERGIRIVREKIKNFASMAINYNYSDIPPYKIIILDEADAMTNDSQFALRRIIEKYSNITRFILLCNYITKIIPPLASRCAKFRFQPVSYTEMKDILINIIKKENFSVIPNDDIFNEIYNFTEGDLRKSITILQRAYFMEKEINRQSIKSIIGDIDNIIFLKSYEIYRLPINSKNLYIKIDKLVKKLLNSGYNIVNFINSTIKYILNTDELNEKQKIAVIKKIAEINCNLDNGLNEYIQIINMYSYINLVYNNYHNIETYEPYTINSLLF